MTDEPEADASKPIALGGPTTAGPAAPEPDEPEPGAPEPVEPAAPEPVTHEPAEPAAHAHVTPKADAPERVAPERITPERITPEPAAPQPAAPVPQRRSVALPLLGLLGFIVLAGAIAYLWVRPVPLPPTPSTPPDQSGAITALQTDVATLKTQLAALDAREKSDVAALHDAIAAIPPPAPAPAPVASPAAAPASPSAATPPAASSPAASSPAASPQAPVAAAATPDLALTQEVAALSTHIAALQAAEAAQAQAAQSLPSSADLSNLAARVDAVAQRESKDGDSVRQDLTLVQQQLAAVTSQTQSLAKTAGALPQLSAKAERLSQIVRAQEALRAGLPLGTIDNAPPALARFATSAAPTEAALRLSYPDAAKAADKAGQPEPDQGRFWHRVLLHVEDLITVRQGDHVIMGDATSGVLAHAERLLNAGDLSGTLSVLGTLTGPAASAMAPWEAQARSLLDAQQALAQMAAG